MFSFKKSVHKLLQIWYQKTFVTVLLLPFSWLFRAAVVARAALYRHRLLTTQRFPVPILVVGNITVGGNGKTPFVIWLVEFLKKQNYQPGIVSRGYGGTHRDKPCIVHNSSNPSVVGEEAVLLKNRTGCPVVVGHQRSEAVKFLLEQFACDVVVSDDGLQHYALGRDIEIVLVDGARREGNGQCLPAGPLREPRSRLATVDFVVVTNGQAQVQEYAQWLQPGAFYPLPAPDQACSLAEFKQRLAGKTLHAVAAIGCPERFFRTLTDLGLAFVPQVFPDHYFFQPGELDYGAASMVIMTEKDAIKYAPYADTRHWCLPVTAQVSAGLAEAIVEKLRHYATKCNALV